LDGARESRPKELFTPFPVMWLLPEEERAEDSADSTYRCPVYKILTRRGTLSTTGHSTNFVMFASLPTKVPPAKWVKAGVALFTALRY
jgi:dynein heavy chain